MTKRRRVVTGMQGSAASELVDLIDNEGRTIGVVTRAQMRAGRLRHRCAYVLVFNRAGELFIHQRTDTKDVFPSYWDVTIGGVLAAGESFDAGAQRESSEELGVSVELERLFELAYSDEQSHVLGAVYRGRHDGPFRLQPEEILRGEFASMDEVKSRVAQAQFCPDGVHVLNRYCLLYGQDAGAFGA